MESSLAYAEGLKDVLVRKITAAEKKIVSLKLDYCRFVYGLSHRSKVTYDQVVYQVRSVDLESMNRGENGEWSKPAVVGVRYESNQRKTDGMPVDLGMHWELHQG
mgnify:CR=1 FL=1